MITNLARHPAPFVTVTEVAEHYGVSEHVIRSRIEKGAVEGVIWVGRLIRIPTGEAAKIGIPYSVASDHE